MFDTVLEHALDRFMAKQARHNVPLKQLMATEHNTQLRGAFEAGIKSQAESISSALQHYGNTLAMRVIADNLVDNHLVKINALVGKELVLKSLTGAFIHGVASQYKSWGIAVKASVTFELTNQQYIDALDNQANYLLNQSSIDDTTRQQLIDLIDQGAQDGLTYDEIAQLIDSSFADIAPWRADMIARTELANAMGSANLATMKENNVTTKEWVAAGDHPCPVCEENESAGEVPVNEPFPSGDESEPAHPRCECYTNAVGVDLSALTDLWSGE